MEQELANVESVEIESDRVEDVEDQESTDSQEITTDTEEVVEEPQPPMYTQEQMQAELNRIAQKERERGKRNAEAQYADYLQMADIIRQGAGIDVSSDLLGTPDAYQCHQSRENEKMLVMAKLCNREWEGELKKKGDTVHILGIGSPTNHAKYFNELWYPSELPGR